MKKATKEIFRNNNRVNPRKQAALEMERQITEFQKGLLGVSPIFPVKINKLPGELNYMVEAGGASCNLHSLFDRERELEMMFAGVDEEIEVLIVFGLGCGYALEYAGSHFPKLERIVVVEPSVDILMRMLSQKEVVSRLSRLGTVNFMFNQPAEDAGRDIANQWTQELKKKYAIVYHLPYRSLFKGYFENMQQIILRAMQQTQVNIIAGDHNLYLKTQNIINNVNAAGIDMQEVLQQIKGKPAIMVSAGPSLNKNIHLLEEAKHKAFVVAVGSAIKILHNKGILPHARAAFSPYPDENTVFDGIDEYNEVPLLFSNTLDYMVVANYDAPKARMVINGDMISRYCYELSGQNCTLVTGGGTIANVTLDLLCRAGCSHIIFMGQDMCMTDNRLYADGSWSDPRVMEEQAGLIKEKDVYGNPVLTTRAFLGIREEIENVLGSYEGIEYINATEGGLPIANTRNMELVELLEELPEMPDISASLQELFAQAEYATPAINQSILQARQEVEQMLTVNQARVDELREILNSEGTITDIVVALQGLQKYEDQLLQIPFYYLVGQYELGNHYYTIRMAYQYQGQDLEKQAESLMQMAIGFSQRVDEYGRFLLELFQKKTAEL